MSNGITEEMIPHIEKALGFELYNHQKDYLLGNGLLMGGRGSGKTTAYCVKLALSDGEPLNLQKMEDIADEWSLPNHRQYARGFFKHELMRIRGKLEVYGFPVCKVRGK
jgi:hypothetical protein